MPPRGFTLPQAQTASAKAARKAFFCDLCQKGYSRMNEFEAHESSYDHQHKKRLKEMKEMQRQVQSGNRKEEKGPLVSIKLGGSSAGGVKRDGGGGGEDGTGGAATTTTGGRGFKKGGFKNAFAAVGEDDDSSGGKVTVKSEDRERKVEDVKMDLGEDESLDSDVTDCEDYYDPRKPTGCHPGCSGRAVMGVV